jgi:small ubiquitin-related modifier
MSKVFNAYAQRKGLDPKALRFLLDGQRIADDETPKTLELEDEDQIDCLLEQLGGKC